MFKSGDRVRVLGSNTADSLSIPPGTVSTIICVWDSPLPYVHELEGFSEMLQADELELA